MHYRRYALLKARAHTAIGEDGLAAAWRTKQAEVSGTSLPDNFPARTALATARYTTAEDIDGADVAELMTYGLNTRDATRAIERVQQMLHPGA